MVWYAIKINIKYVLVNYYKVMTVLCSSDVLISTFPSAVYETKKKSHELTLVCIDQQIMAWYYLMSMHKGYELLNIFLKISDDVNCCFCYTNKRTFKNFFMAICMWIWFLECLPLTSWNLHVQSGRLPKMNFSSFLLGMAVIVEIEIKFNLQFVIRCQKLFSHILEWQLRFPPLIACR